MKPCLTLICALVLFASLAAVPAASADRTKGIDVSLHQGKIEWRKVSDRIRFVFAKATEGGNYVDQRTPETVGASATSEGPGSVPTTSHGPAAQACRR